MCQREGEFVCGCGSAVQLWGPSSAFTHLVSMVTEQAKLYFLQQEPAKKVDPARKQAFTLLVLRELLKPQKFVSLEGDQV